MFSFHKPKIYRSNLGCCICKAKSSSSRFTDSKKYENEFEQCFRLKEKRSGEICNACVLLVKRWKKLTPENRLTKHWHHVVDARAGPGTKLTGNRRLTSSNSHQRSATSNSSSSSGNTTGTSNDTNESNGSKHRTNTSATGRVTGMLPLSSSTNQTNQLGSKGLSKVCAIDTNVSTFTFGEPIVNVNRTRSYMSSNNESGYHATISASSSSSSPLSLKPQSALNSSAFESVIKRFRQRQQQQHLEAQRRKLNRQQRAQQRAADNGSIKIKKDDNSLTDQQRQLQQQEQSNIDQAAKRAQRYSSTENSFGVGSVLDGSIWRKEKICCGVIFRGLYNEIAIVPRLLRPCQCRLTSVRGKNGAPGQRRKTNLSKGGVTSENDKVLLNNIDREEEDEDAEDDDGEEEEEEQVPPPRATKSGSISSCESNTSGCGSMEEANSGSVSSGLSTKRTEVVVVGTQRKRRRLENNKQLNVQSPSGSSSGNSSSQLVVGYGEEEEEEEQQQDDIDDDVEDIMIDRELVLEADASSTNDSSNDTTASSVESLASSDLSSKQSNAVALR